MGLVYIAFCLVLLKRGIEGMNIHLVDGGWRKYWARNEVRVQGGLRHQYRCKTWKRKNFDGKVRKGYEIKNEHTNCYTGLVKESL